MFKKFGAILLAVLLTASLTACGDKADQGEETSPAGTESSTETASTGGEFILGSPQPLSGANAQAAEATINGIKLAIEDVNAAGGLNGQQIKLITYDDQGSPEEAIKIANKMVDIDRVNAVIGPLLSTSQMAQGARVNDAKIPTVAIGLSPTFMAEQWDYVVRGSLNSDYVMTNLARDMEVLDIKSIAIFSGQDDASQAAAKSMRSEAEKKGIAVTTTETYVDGDNDFSGQAAKIINTKPDAVFVASFASVQPIIAKQLRQFGFDGLCFNKEVFQADGMSIAGDAANYWAFSYPYISYTKVEDCDIPNMRVFIEKYQAAYGELPPHEGACRGYDSVMILAEGAKNAGSNEADAIMAGINQISDYEGLGGTFDYSAGTGEGLNSSQSYIIIDGKYTLLDAWLESGGYEEFKASRA